jgi:NAD-dependent dihydropyrimidine dehydrogenase PreA subunit/flavodoxin
MKILLIYYTGTYNTRYVTNVLKNRLIKSNNFVDTVEVNRDTPLIKLDGYDIVGLGYPIYAFNSPELFNKYLKKLKFIPNKKYFIYKNSGETLDTNNSSSRVIFSLLKHRKCEINNEYHIVMPYTIHFRFDDRFVKEILNYLDKQVEIITFDLMSGKKATIPTTFKITLTSKLYAIQRIGGFVNSMFYKVDYNKCVKCDLCLDNCPVHNIGFKNNKYIFGRHCQMCMRCSFYCPENAIKIGLYDKWRVNGAYDFKKIHNNEKLELPYITKDSSGFYKCFIKTFEDIDSRYNEIRKIK